MASSIASDAPLPDAGVAHPLCLFEQMLQGEQPVLVRLREAVRHRLDAIRGRTERSIPHDACFASAVRPVSPIWRPAQRFVVDGCPSTSGLSPDGCRAAWVVAPYTRAGEHPESAVWVGWTDAREPARRWTRGGADRHPRWSPDGGRIAFLSDRVKRGIAGIHLIPADGGEAAPIVVRERTVSAFAWSPDASRIAFTAPDEPSDEDRRRERDRDDAVVNGRATPPDRLHVVDVVSGVVTTLDTGSAHVASLAWSPDGGRLGYVTWPTPALDDASRGSLYVIAAGGGEPATVCRARIGDLAWSADGRRLVFVAPHGLTAHSGFTAWSVDPEAGEPAIIGPGPDDPCCGLALARPAPNGVPVVVAEGLDTRVEWRDPASGRAAALYASRGLISSFDVVVTAEGPSIAAVEATPDLLPEIWAGPAAAPRRLSDHHAPAAGISSGKREAFHFVGADGCTWGRPWPRRRRSSAPGRT